MRIRIALITLAFAAAPGFAVAQAPPKTKVPTAPRADESQSAACAQADTHATVGQGGDVKVPTPEGKDLSQKLAQSNGVICPPAVDPDMTAPPPKGGALKVIPPPGTPGSGKPEVQPK